MKSLGTMIQELNEYNYQFGISNEWEEKFINDMYVRSERGRFTTSFSEKQVEKIEQLHAKYCEGLQNGKVKSR